MRVNSQFFCNFAHHQFIISSMKHWQFFFVLQVCLLCSAAMLLNAQPFPYENPSFSPEQRAEDLCSRLNLEEKAKLMLHRSPAIERLNVPAFEWWNEALHGVGRSGFATVFPITMGMAATFDDQLVYRVFTAVSDEARAKNTEARRKKEVRQYQGLSFYTPNINIFRDPRWGRGQETYGEDPFLTSQMGLAVVRGLQGEGQKYLKTLACAKHFAVHSGPEWNRHSFDVEQLPARDLWETYLPAFKALVQQGHVKEVMCAYQRIDGEPCCGNTRFLQHILRDEWGFLGLVTSDCWAVADFWQKGHHEFSATKEDAVARAVVTGTDLECGSDYRAIPDAVAQGKLTEEQVDISLKRLLQARFELGDFDDDQQVAWTDIPMSVVCSAEHRELALQAARESMTLLKNDGILPLCSKQRIVVVGPNADNASMQWGNYNGFPTETITILDGIRSKSDQVSFLDGFEHVGKGMDEKQLLAEHYLSRISDADVVVFVGGISPRLEGEEMSVDAEGFKGGDRLSIELPKVQRDFLAALHAMGKPVVYVNCSGSAMGLVPEQANANAILQAWYPGEQGGRAVADVLFGDYNPSGKLPVTFYRSVDQLPDYEDYRMAGRTYRYFQGEPLYPFGFGLSYTTFKLGTPSYQNGKVKVDITNTGKQEGAEVVQVYLRDPRDTDGPIKTLRAYQRVNLQPGEQRTLTIDLPRERFELWDTATNTMRVRKGKYEIMVGTSSADSDLQRFSVKLP